MTLDEAIDLMSVGSSSEVLERRDDLLKLLIYWSYVQGSMTAYMCNHVKSWDEFCKEREE